jgi:hypothetical protein
MYDGYYQSSDGFPSSDTDEQKIGPYLIQFGDVAEVESAPSKTPAPSPPALRRNVLSRGGLQTHRPSAAPTTSVSKLVAPAAAAMPVRDQPRSFDEIMSFFADGEPAPPPKPPEKEKEKLELGATVECPSQIQLFWRKQSFGQPPAIPATFQTVSEYCTAFVGGIVFELNAQIQEVYKLYVGALFAASCVAPKCKEHGPTQFRIDRRGGYYFSCKSCHFYQPVSPDAAIPERKGVRSVAAIGNWMHSRGIGYHESTFLRKGTNCSLRFSDEKLDSVEYSKDDLWVIFGEKTDAIFAVSDSFGVSQKNRIELAPFFDARLLSLATHLKVTAIRLLNAQTERATLARLCELEQCDIPVLHAMLSGGSECDPLFPGVEIEMETIERIADNVAARFHLNEDQRSALSRVSRFFAAGAPPIVLVHGIFGSGKSKLLAVIAVFLHEVLTKLGRSEQVLVAASTNVAVDNILSNLRDFDFTLFARVGSVRKIRRSLLPFVSGHGSDEAIAELSSIAAESDRADQSIVQEALRNARTEMGGRTARIDGARVVGVTCAATAFPIMAGRRFPFVLLDECSQQTEPVSLLPISFGGARLVCCGDPLQLPPTLTREAPKGYGRPLFSRLMGPLGAHMLGIQYRCHPAIAQICSRLFYGGRVRNGISEEERQPLFEMPTLCVFDVACGEERFDRGSIRNTAEAIVVVAIVRFLLEKGIAAHQIGVIAFYRSQVESIAEPLSDGRKRPIVDVSTVDAFQGDEREVIVITTAKTTKTSFIDSKERVNVAISRAKRHLFIVSNVRPLIDSELWNVVFYAAGNRPHLRVRLESAPDAAWQPFS